MYFNERPPSILAQGSIQYYWVRLGTQDLACSRTRVELPCVVRLGTQGLACSRTRVELPCVVRLGTQDPAGPRRDYLLFNLFVTDYQMPTVLFSCIVFRATGTHCGKGC